MPRPPVKKTRKLAEAQAFGQTLGEMKARLKFCESDKGYWNSLREHIGKLIDQIDPLELFAVGGLTVVIQPMVYESQKFLDYASKAGSGDRVSNIVDFTVRGLLLTLFPMLDVYLSPSQEDAKVADTKSPNVLLSYIVAFVLAFMVMKFSTAIVADGGIIKLMGSLI